MIGEHERGPRPWSENAAAFLDLRPPVDIDLNGEELSLWDEEVPAFEALVAEIAPSTS